jgi:hypothetical protein
LHENEVVFGDVEIAASIWDVTEVENPTTKQKYKFDSIVNGAHAMPARGDLLIYSKEYLGTGHVAVITAVNSEAQTIHVAEQNFFNTKWQANYAREIPYTIFKDRIWILDSYLVGWKRVTQ